MRAAVLLLAWPLAVVAQPLVTPEVIYVFPAAPKDPEGTLVEGTDGTFYGTTYFGGSAGQGTVFSITTNGDLTTLASFYGSNGANPAAGLTLAWDGNLYGTTYSGGASDLGTVFKVTTNGLLTTLVSFNGDNGAYPWASLTPFEGCLFGTTYGGGTSNMGTLFRMTTNGPLTNLINFVGTNGCWPRAKLTPGPELRSSTNTGTVVLYGTTEDRLEVDGTSDFGSIFKCSSAGALTTLSVVFNRWSGKYPHAGVTFVTQWANNKYDLETVCSEEGLEHDTGIIKRGTHLLLTQPDFEDPDFWEIAGEPYYFNGLNGAVPETDLVAYGDGYVFGTTSQGGPLWYTNFGYGTVYMHWGRLFGETPPNDVWHCRVFFDGTNAAWPRGGLTLGSDGNLYGTTASGFNGNGTVFKVRRIDEDPYLELTTLCWLDFPNGGGPGGLTPASDGSFYGMTASGGKFACGTAFKLATNGALTTLATFGNTNHDSSPSGQLTLGNDGNFYGTSASGGYGGGTVFRLTPQGELTTLVQFNGTNGSDPEAALTLGPDGCLYGTTSRGGIGYDPDQFGTGNGSVFRVTTNGVWTPLVWFDGANGAHPYSAGLTLGPDGNFYGTTSYGGSNNYGTVFKMTSGGDLTSLVSFAGTNGNGPTAGLTLGGDGCFYGTTASGGGYDYGTVFKVTTNGELTTLASLDPEGSGDGAFPDTDLIFGSDGCLYGTTYYGGDGFMWPWFNGFGTLFCVTTNGFFRTLIWFDPATKNPSAPVTLGSDGKLYGTASSGGGEGGVIFRVGIPAFITAQPASRTNAPGTTATFNVSAAGGTPFTYQWRKNGTNLLSTGSISGATTNTLSISGVSAADAGDFSVLITNAFGSVTSSVATLTVTSSSPARPQILFNDGSFGYRSNQFGFNLSGSTGSVVIVEVSSNLFQWASLWTNTLGSSPVYFSDPSCTNFSRRFYRARLE